LRQSGATDQGLTGYTGILDHGDELAAASPALGRIVARWAARPRPLSACSAVLTRTYPIIRFAPSLSFRRWAIPAGCSKRLVSWSGGAKATSDGLESFVSFALGVGGVDPLVSGRRLEGPP
jgi:hypothetical protein